MDFRATGGSLSRRICLHYRDLADSSKAKRELGWAPKVSFKDLVKIMADADLEAAGLSSPGEGRKIISDKCLAWNEHY